MIANSKNLTVAVLVMVLGFQTVAFAQGEIQVYGAFDLPDTFEACVPNQVMYPSFWIENVGNQTVSGLGSQMYFSNDTNISSDDTLIWSGSWIKYSLVPDERFLVGWPPEQMPNPITCPVNYTEGTYYIIHEVFGNNLTGRYTVYSQVTLTGPTPPPSKPINPSPINGATDQSITDVIIRWQNGGCANSYRIYFGTDSSPDNSEYIGIQTNTSFYPGILNYGTTYYWRIDATNSTGTTTGNVWRFSTKPEIAGDVKAEYFAGIIPQGIPCSTQFEQNIDNIWGVNDVIACTRRDGVSARWTAELVIPANDTYTFSTMNDDGVRLYLNRERIIDDWNDGNVRNHTSSPQILEEGFYPLMMEWYHNSGPGNSQLYWQTPTMGRQIIPPVMFQPPPQPQRLPDGGTEVVFEAESFEHFNDQTILFETWVGGGHPADLANAFNNGTGMTVGNLVSPYVEETIVYSGQQSMPLRYDNTKKPYYSQADRTWDTAQDWTAEGIIALHMQVHGRPQNAPEPFYVRIEDTAGKAGVVFNSDPDILRRDDWTAWWIPLSGFAGVDLTGVKKMSIGMGKPPTGPAGLLNDDWTNAMPIGNVTNLMFDTTEATVDGPQVCMSGANIWYCYTAPCTGISTISLCGSSFDTTLAVYRGCGSTPTSGGVIQCNDDFCGRQSQVDIPVTAGQKYLIEVGGFNILESGSGVLNITCDNNPGYRPPNDYWFDADSIGNVSNLGFDTTYATKDGPGDIDSPNIWFCYTAPCTGAVTVSLCGSNFDTKLAIYEGCGTFPRSENSIEYNDDFCGRQSQVAFGAIKDQEYLIEVGGFDDDSTGRGRISIWCGLTASIEPDLGNTAGPVGSIHSNSTAVTHLGKKVSDTIDEGDLTSPNLSDGLKLLDNHNPEPGGDGKAIIDQVITVGAGPASLYGSVRSSPGGPMVSNAKISLVPRSWMGEFWHETGEPYSSDYNYIIDAVKGVYDVTVTKGGTTKGPTRLILDGDVEENFVLP